MFLINNLKFMPLPFVVIEVLGWSIFSTLVPVVVLRIIRIVNGENHWWRRPERVADAPDDFKIDIIFLGSLSPRNKLFK